MPDILEDSENGLTQTMRQLLERLTNHLKELDRASQRTGGANSALASE